MSVPLSLRLCCVAAMAPALTETSGHSRIQLTGTPAKDVAETHATGVNGAIVGSNHSTAVNGFDIASVKGPNYNSKINGCEISSENSRSPTSLAPIKGVFKSVPGNGTVYRLDTSVKSSKSLKDLHFVSEIPSILKQLSTARTESDSVSDHSYLKVVDKTMNQPSNGNGPNGTGKKFMKQSSYVGERTLNGHASKQSELDVTNRIPPTRIKIPATKSETSKFLGVVNSLSLKPTNMCRTSVPCTNACSSKPSTSSSKISQSRVSEVIERGVRVADAGAAILGLQSECLDSKSIDSSESASRKQVLLERRSQFLMRRLRRLEGKQLEGHIKGQLKSFVNFQHHNLQSAASKAIRPFGDVPSTFFNSNDVKNLSTSNLVSLVRRLQSSQQKSSLEQQAVNKKVKDERRGVLFMEQKVSSESERKAGHLQTSLKHWSSAVDSDATESSSGGESCEEWEDCPLMTDKPAPLYKRAEWKWAVDRAAIVSRWTWLQAQVSDLEYRIRQQSEIHKTIRTSKGVVTLGEAPIARTGVLGAEASPANVTTLMINVSKQASKLSQSLGNCLSPLQAQSRISDSDRLKQSTSLSKSLNGFVDSSHLGLTTTGSQNVSSSSVPCGTPVTSGSGVPSVNSSPDLSQLMDESCVAARCRPVRFYRKRKLLRTYGLHQVNHKAARLSSVKCHCYPPVTPCPMCGGRYNNVQRLDAEGMPVMEKVSLLDPAYHPVLSFPQEIALPVHFEALLKSGEWQSSRAPPKITMRAIAAEKRRQKILNAQIKEQARKRKKYNKAAVLLQSAKLRTKYDGKTPLATPKKITTESRLRRKELKRRRAAQLAVAAARKAAGRLSRDTDQDSLSTISRTPTPSPQMRDDRETMALRKKRFENAYDINNIVIPYSMAASTRVEKLQYKEIQTPKWRILSSEELALPAAGETADSEQHQEEEVMTEEAFVDRHQPFEAEERKRFRSFVTYPPVRRSRPSRESESHDVLSPELYALEAQYNQDDAQSLNSSGSHSTIREDLRKASGVVTSRRSSFLDECSSDVHDGSRTNMEPWPAREFPLNEDYYEEMKQEQMDLSSAPVTRTYTRAKAVRVEEDMEFVSQICDQPDSPTVPGSPLHSMSSLDDMNDPDWNQHRGGRRSSVSTRHSKR